jgi:integration host factor subunit alpha
MWRGRRRAAYYSMLRALEAPPPRVAAPTVVPRKRLWGYETTMTKAEIVQALYARVGGFSKKESADLVDLVFEMMKETLGRGEKIKISGFGNFVLRDKRQRPGRNPQTGDPIKISERRVLTFKASQVLKQGLNPRTTSEPHINGLASAVPAAATPSSTVAPSASSQRLMAPSKA